MGCDILGALCGFLGYGKKPGDAQGVQLKPAKDPPNFKSGLLADAGILWVQFFRRLLIPKYSAADYSKVACPSSEQDREAMLRRCRQSRKAKRECKCRAKCNSNESTLVESDRCKEYRENLKVEENKHDRTLMKDRLETKSDDPSKCGRKPSTTTIHCDKCNKCTRIIDCSGHDKP